MAHECRVYPLGYPVDIRSESQRAISIAQQHWPEPSGLFAQQPLQVHIALMEAAPLAPLEFHAVDGGFVFARGPAGSARFDAAGRCGMLRATRGALSRDSGESLLDALVLTALDWTFFAAVHAGCVALEGRSVLLCGDSEAGKSTLAYACARAGWTYVSDNALHWAPPPHDVFVTGSPSIRLREGARILFPHLESHELRPMPNGRLAMEIIPALDGLQAANSALAGPCVFLDRRPGPAGLLPYSTDAAVEYFLRYDTCPDREAAAKRYRRMLNKGVWRLKYEYLEDAMRILRELL
ncbi:MAG: hypothetical protein ABI995_15870 [Acidobacteriota bacterium]